MTDHELLLFRAKMDVVVTSLYGVGIIVFAVLIWMLIASIRKLAKLPKNKS